MIDFLFAEKNIYNYKYDYSGYLVIVDKIRTFEVLQSNEIKKMQEHLKDMKKKYQKELSLLKKHDTNECISKISAYKLSKSQLINELNYILKVLPAIGFIILGKEKEIGINNLHSNKNLIN